MWKRKVYAEGVATGQLPFLLRKNYIQKYLHIWYNSSNL